MEKMETALLTEFHKWASPVVTRLRSHSDALRTLDLEIESLQNRVDKLEKEWLAFTPGGSASRNAGCAMREDLLNRQLLPVSQRCSYGKGFELLTRQNDSHVANLRCTKRYILPPWRRQRSGRHTRTAGVWP